MSKTINQRAKQLVHDPIFQKPIKEIDYSKQGHLICVTKFSRIINLKTNKKV